MTEPVRPNPIPDSYRRITPCLTVHGAAQALEFYAAVFGAAERMRFPGPGGTIAHAEIEIGDSVVIIEDEDPRRGTKAPPSGGLPGSPVRLDHGEMVITDGPFVEGKEVVSGYTEIEVADLDEALRMVKTWPGCPLVEIRPLES